MRRSRLGFWWNALSGASFILFLCVWLAILCAISFGIGSFGDRDAGYGWNGELLFPVNGDLYFEHVTDVAPPPPNSPLLGRGSNRREFCGITILRWIDVRSRNRIFIAGQFSYHLEVWISIFWPLSITLCFPISWLVKRYRGVRRARLARQLERSGRCAACAYDLRGSPARCPECGQICSVADIAIPKIVPRWVFVPLLVTTMISTPLIALIILRMLMFRGISPG
jgi:hypothetical protein